MKTNSTTLENGLRIVTCEMPDSQSVTISMLVGVGSRFEDFHTNGGVSHFLEHLLFKGTAKRPSTKIIAEAIDEVGGLQNAYTSTDLTNYYVKLPKQHFALGFDVLADMIRNPLLEAAEIDRERGVVIEEMNMDRDEPGRHVQELLPPLLWPNDPLSRPVLGTEEIINTISRDTIADYQKSHYGPRNMVVSVSGNVKHDEVVAAAREHMGDMIAEGEQNVATLTVGKGNLSNYLKHETNQAHILIGSVAYPYDDPRDAAARVLTNILGSGLSSRLFLTVREQLGAAYTVAADYHSYTDTGQFDVYAGLNLDKIEKGTEAIMHEFAKIRDELVGEEELQRAKNKISGSLQMSLENTFSVADRQGSQWLLLGRIEPVEETLARINAVTAADIQKVARELLAPSNLRMAAIAPDPELIESVFMKEISK